MSRLSSSTRSSISGVIETVGQDLARQRDQRSHGFENENGHARGTLPRAKRYSDRPTDLHLQRPSVIVEDCDVSESDDAPLPITARMRRVPT